MSAAQPPSAQPPSAQQPSPPPSTQPATGGAEAHDLTAMLAEALTRVSWRLRRASMKELAPLGLTFAQSRALRILSRHDEPLRIGDLAARFEVAPRSATSLIDTLETAGLVERLGDPTDRRSVLVGLTPEGHELMERVTGLRRASAQRLFGRLDLEQQQRLLALLSVLGQGPDDCGPVSPPSPPGDRP
jgi:DNA-binding MarR family transcriptional regulator